jgi:hypothetical protein
VIADFVAEIIRVSDIIYEQEYAIDQLTGDDRPSLTALSNALARLTPRMRELKATLQYQTGESS